jgi:C1A family cysteine protease
MRRYGWSPDLKDHRDFPYRPKVTRVPAVVDLRPGCPAIYDQGQLGSCTGNGIAGVIEYALIREKRDMVPSRLFIYFNERDEEGTVQSDAGASIRDGIKAVASLGVPPESEWPYSDANPGPFQTKPPANVYADALKYKVSAYESISLGKSPVGLSCLGTKKSVVPLQQCLASGAPVVYGMTVYESFESAQVAKTGMVPMPGSDEAVLGGHALVLVGYDAARGCFLVRNSWGAGWGLGGYFWLPFQYVLRYASDFWTIKTVMTP